MKNNLKRNMKEKYMDCKCNTCKIHKEAVEENVCCAWYMDNVVCGDKYIKDCSVYEEDG